MKTHLSFYLLVLLLAVGACKKEQKDLCAGVVCQNGHCENGVCVCDTGYSGAHCDSLIPSLVDLLAGNYHMVGYSQTTVGGTVYPPNPIDDTVTITTAGDSALVIYADTLLFVTYFGDTLYNYNYLWMPASPSNYAALYFHKPLQDDSAFYNSRYGGLGGGTNTYLSGIKIH